MSIAFVLSRPPEAAPLWDLIGPIKEAGDRVEFWLPGPVSAARPPVCSPIPDLVIYDALAGGGSAHAENTDAWNVRYHDDSLRRLETLWAERRPGLILFPASLGAHELGVRLSARLNCGCFPETRRLLREGGRLFARKKVCGSNLDWDAEITGRPAVVTVMLAAAVTRAGKQAVTVTGEGSSPRTECRPLELSLPPWVLDYEVSEISPASPLERSPLIFAAGRGLGSGAACERLRRAAGRFGAPLGFSRPAALNGWGGIGEIIGQSGLRCGAETCVAVGVSGAAAFMAGIEAASTLIAVNPDKNAPIFRYADIGIVTGAEEFITALETDTETIANAGET
jgi:electron transfer flavoprotein alpha subunit